MRLTNPFEHELICMANECGLTRQQREAVAEFYRQQINAVMEIAADLVAEEDHTCVPTTESLIANRRQT